MYDPKTGRSVPGTTSWYKSRLPAKGATLKVKDEQSATLKEKSSAEVLHELSRPPRRRPTPRTRKGLHPWLVMNAALKRYYRLIRHYQERQQRVPQHFLAYHEHHILPLSFGGLDTPENLVRVTPYEHLQLHKCLTDCTQDDGADKMRYAYEHMLAEMTPNWL